MRREAKAKERKRTFLVIGSAIGFCAILIGIVTGIALNNAAKSRAERKIPGLQTFKVSSAKHVTTDVKYAQTPPVGGDHNPVWLNCGVYTTPQKTEMAVHDMEHGAVWITYGPGTSGAQIAKLQFLAKQDGLYQGAMYTTVTPFTGLKANDIYASAWGYQVKVDNADDPRLVKFLKRFVHGAENTQEKLTNGCSGGQGTPKV